MKSSKQILIVGAGPSGLSMAIFLSELGYKPQIIDKKASIGIHSKALGVNPRTLEIFERYGITERFLTNGRKMDAVNIWKGDKYIYKNKLSEVNHKYPFMLIQPQKESEEILLDEVLKRNINVEYGTELIAFEQKDEQKREQKDQQYCAAVQEANTKTERNINYIIGADGGHSKVREKLGIEYKGFRYDEEWEIFDLELDMNLNKDEGHVRVFPEGGMIMIRLKDNVWRLAGNMKGLLNYLPKDTKIGSISWESKFRIHHKIAQKLVDKQIGLIGDAAHLHSPVGARGMNLGIEDAFIMSKLLHNDNLSAYQNQRMAYLEKTVNQVNNITMGLAGNSSRSKFLRNQIGFFKILFPLIMPRVRKFILGLN